MADSMANAVDLFLFFGGSPQRDQSTSRVTKWTNGHASCISHLDATPRSAGIRGSRCTTLIHAFTLEPSSGASLLLSTSVLHREQECRHYSDSSGGHDLALEQSLCRQPHKDCTVASSPMCFSTKRAISIKEQQGWSHLFKYVLSPVRFWVWSFPGAWGRSWSLPHMAGHLAH